MSIQQLILDIGNTYTKVYIFDQKKISCKYKYTRFTEKQLQKLKKLHSKIGQIIVSSVKNLSEEFIFYINHTFSHVVFLNDKTKLPFKNLYGTPETLGRDRIAAAAGAIYFFPNTNVLVIDAGTAITYEFITANAEYLGGNISPGLNTRFKSLNHFTKKLPLQSPNPEIKNLYGQNTSEAIWIGVQQGLLFEIEAYITNFEQVFYDNKVILTGGDTFFFANKLKKTIFAKPDLLAFGLHNILLYNIRNTK